MPASRRTATFVRGVQSTVHGAVGVTRPLADRALRFALAAVMLIASTFHLVRSTAVAGTPVALELVLAVDVSASIDDHEFRLQIKGLVRAFRHPQIIAAIQSLGENGLAVTLMQWSSNGQQVQAIPWTRITDESGAMTFARLIEAKGHRRFEHGTAIGSAVLFGRRLINTNIFDGRRRSIDVSGDGINNNGPPVTLARDITTAEGITINGLAVLSQDSQLGKYYRKAVIGGPGAFVMEVRDYDNIITATRRKLLREIQPFVARGTGSTIVAEVPGDAKQRNDANQGWRHSEIELD